MKTTNQLLFLLAIVGLMSCKNQMHVVTLYVNTANIEQGTIPANANFGQPMGLANEDFTTYVRKGDLVIWNGVSISDPSEEVYITNITDEPGTDVNNKGYVNFFDRNILTVDNTNKIGGKSKKGTIVGAIINGKRGDVQKYKLTFTVKDKDGSFTIDPKMHMY